MPVFRLFYKIVKSNLTAILFSFVLLLVVTIPLTLISRNQYSGVYEKETVSIAVFNHDTENPLSSHLIDYLDHETNIVPLDETPEAIADALFSDQISYALTIPEGFGQAILEQKTPIPLERRTSNVPESVVTVNSILTSYLTNAQMLSVNLGDNPSAEDIDIVIDQLTASLDNDIKVETQGDTEGLTEIYAFGSIYTTVAGYGLIATFITVFGYAIVALRKREVMKRNRLGQLTQSKQLTQLLLASFSFSLIDWLLIMIIGIFLFGPDVVFSDTGLLIVLSSFLSMLGIQSFAYFVSTIAPNKGTIQFLANFLSLFLSFASGIFVPRSFLPTFMQHIASVVTPIWQVRANELILSSNDYTTATWQTIWQYFGIMLLITIAHYAMSFVIQSYRHRQNVYL